jgi:hypothetical protein
MTAIVVTLACSGEDSAPSAGGPGPPSGSVPGGCRPGEFEPCECAAGFRSVRECLPDGARGECRCERWGPDAGNWQGGTNPQPGVTIVKWPAFHLESDPAQDLFYVTIGNPAPEHEDSLIALDPDGSVRWATGVAGAPSTFAISKDGTQAHVGVRAEPAIVRVDLATRRELGRSAIPPYAQQPSYVYDIEGIPGDADRVLVVYSTNPLYSTTGTALLLDAGVQIGQATPNYVSADEIAVRDASTAYAYDATSTGSSLYTLALSAAGLTLGKSTSDVLDDFARDFSFDGQWLVTGEGQAVDPVTQTVVGRYALRGKIVSNRARDRVYMVTTDDTADLQIVVFDRDGFQELGRLTLEGVRGTVLRMRQSSGGTLGLVIDSKADRLEPDNWIVLVRPTALPGG